MKGGKNREKERKKERKRGEKKWDLMRPDQWSPTSAARRTALIKLILMSVWHYYRPAYGGKACQIVHSCVLCGYWMTISDLGQTAVPRKSWFRWVAVNHTKTIQVFTCCILFWSYAVLCVDLHPSDLEQYTKMICEYYLTHLKKKTKNITLSAYGLCIQIAWPIAPEIPNY